MAEADEPQPIPLITSRDAVPPPLPLPVPLRKRRPRWVVPAVSAAVFLLLAAFTSCAAFVVVSGFRDFERTRPVSPLASAETSDDAGEAETLEDGFGGYLSGDAQVVKGAKPGAAFIAALQKDYPGWKFSAGRLSVQKWSGGGSQQWDAHLESRRYPSVLLRVEYLQTLDGKGDPADPWETDEDFFKAGATPDADSLLDRFVHDAKERPMLIYSAHEDDPGPQRRTVRFSYKEAGYRETDKLYQLEKDGRWTQLP